jgi:site-specific recombinase
VNHSYLNNIVASEKRLLVAFTKYLRYLDNNEEAFNMGFNDIIELLKSDEKLAHRFSFEVRSIFRLEGFGYVLSASNIQLHGSFWQEFSSKIRAKILPKLNSANAFKFRLQKLFNFDLDSQWLSKITKEQLRQLTDIAFSTKEENDNQLQETVAIAIRLVSHKIAALGIENRMVIRHQNPLIHQNQFMELPHLVARFLEIYKSGIDAEHSKDNVRVQLDKLRRHLQDVIDASEIQGTDIQKTFLVSKTRQLIDRLENLCVCMQPGNQDADYAIHRIAQDIVEEEYSSQNFRGFFKSNLKTLSLRVSEHTSHTGEHYIATGLRDYSKFLYAAIGAGFIVSVLVFFKTWLHMSNLPLFWEAMVFSLNYVLGFVLIQIFHFTLATKQPAMTANAIARSLDSKDGKPNIPELGITIAKVFHTQTISFIGNLLIVFPIPFLISWGLDGLLDYSMYNQNEAVNVMNNQHPFRSGALWFAAITGVFLFASGLIAGYVDNRIIFSRVPERVRQLKNLKKIIGFKSTMTFSKYLETNAGSLAGNISLGFFLGTATFFGSITGFPFDIRHITFAAGSFSSALYFAGDAAVLKDVIITIIGILFIGVINFGVSFGLAFYFACKSRDISIRQTPELFTFLWKYLKKYPQDFLTAPRQPRKPSDIVGS